MSSTTEALAKSSDELKEEVDAALSRVGQDLTVLKQDLTPKQVINEVVLKDRFMKVRRGLQFVRENATVLTGVSLVLGFLIARKVFSKRTPHVTF